LVLMRSLGNASVESGFSVNSDILVDNLHEESLVARRIMYDTIQTGDGILKVEITKTNCNSKLIRTLRAGYDEALKKKRDVSASDEWKAKEKKVDNSRCRRS